MPGVIQAYLPTDDMLDLCDFRRRHTAEGKQLSDSMLVRLILQDFLSNPNPERIFEGTEWERR